MTKIELNHDYGLMIDVIEQRLEYLNNENSELKELIRELEIKLGYHN